MARHTKERHRNKLLEFLGNPENEFVNREHMPSVCGIKKATFRTHFSPTELAEIESEALEMRRKKYAPRLSKADSALLNKAAEGDVAAIKLAYQRFEDWGEMQKRELQHEFPRLMEAIEAAKAGDED